MACRTLLAVAALLCFSLGARADTVYYEAISGDFSNSGLTPSVVVFEPGSNQLVGSLQGIDVPSLGLDRDLDDYFTFTVAPGHEFIALINPGVGGPAGRSFARLSIQLGSQVTVPVDAVDATGLLGWMNYNVNYSDADIDLLPTIGSAGEGSTGFVPPLPAGVYSVWVQFESSAFTFQGMSYRLDFRIAPVPEPESGSLLVFSLFALGVARSRAAMLMISASAYAANGSRSRGSPPAAFRA